LIIEIVYTWPDGRQEVRYRRPAGSLDAVKYVNEVLELQRRATEGGYVSPYSYRSVEHETRVTQKNGGVDYAHTG
jgi:hypothetical protein